MQKTVFRRCFFIAIIACSFSEVHLKDYYTGAVFEHARLGDEAVDPPMAIVRANLKMYEKAAKVAKDHDADIIVFPEYGLYFAVARNDLKPFLEWIPNPKKERVNPCDQKIVYCNRPILYSLSCIAKENRMIVAANMGGIEKCGRDSRCPKDGVLQHNTNVVFGPNGALLARYYKEHPILEDGTDVPTEDQDPTFVTHLGKFATCPGFEILRKKIAQVSREVPIEAVLYSTKWLTLPPSFSATQLWQSWAMGNNMTLLAANVQRPGDMNIGSGIFIGREGAIASTFSPDGISKLIISTIPKRNKHIHPHSIIFAVKQNGTEMWDTSAERVPLRCSLQALGKPRNIHTDHRCISEDVANYTLVKLNETEGHIKLCNHGLCCELDYAADKMTESFYFGVHNGTRNFQNKYFWAEENCFLARCNDADGKPCSEFLMQSATTFSKVKMTAKFSTSYIYPSFVANEMRLVSVDDWTYKTNDKKAYIYFSNDTGVKLLVSGFAARPYNRDPPYTQYE